MSAGLNYKEDCFFVEGELNFANAANLWEQSLGLLGKSSKLCFDLSQVVATNSAGLALLVEWMKYAKREKKLISFANLPKQLLSIARVCGVEEILLKIRN